MRALLFRFLVVLVAPLALAGLAAPEGAIPAVTAERFLPQVRDQLAAHFHPDGELQIDLTRTWFPPTTPAAPWEMRVLAPPAALAAHMLVRVRLVADQRNLGEWNLPLRAQLWSEAFVAREPLARGANLDPSVLDRQRTDLLREKHVVPAGANLDQFTVQRSVAAGTLLTWTDLGRRTLVQRGGRIEVIATDGPLTITLKGQAMQSGALGETILVRNLESRRDFPAVVTAENRVRVTF